MAYTNRSDIHEVFIQLVNIGIGTANSANIPNNTNWLSLKALADEQGLTAVVLDGIESMPNNQRPPQGLLLEWIGEVLQNYEQRYVQYKEAIGGLAGFYNHHGLKMMVLKGYACSLDWPQPNHRPCGDIDIWQFGKQVEADATVSKEKGIKIDNSHHHHTVFWWGDFMVENHYDFVNVHHSKSNAKIEKVLKNLGEDDSRFVEVDDASTGSATKVYLPSPNLHALFLLRHAMVEFAAGGISLKQVLDWAFFVEKHTKEIDWNWLETVLEEFGMRRLYDIFNEICVENLGFEVNIFSSVQFKPSMKDRVLKEILNPAIPNEKPKQLFKRLIWKWHRWKANEWKHRLVYRESMWSAFLSGVWSHMLKPASI